MPSIFSATKRSKPARTRTDVDWYSFFKLVIADGREEPDDYIAIISKRDPYELEPKNKKDKKDIPLLALASSNKKWFSYFIEKCDPTVEWEEEGGDTRMNLDKLLQAEYQTPEGEEMYDIYQRKKEQWRPARQNLSESRRSTNDTSQRTNYKTVAIKMGLVAAAGAAVALGGLPLSAVGSALWEAISKMDSIFSASEPTEELEKLFDQNMKVLGHILKLLNARIEAAKTAASQSNDLELRRKYDEEKGRRDTLKLILDHATKDISSIQQSKDSYDEKKEQMEKMLKELHTHREGLMVLVTLDNIKEFGVDLHQVVVDLRRIQQTGDSSQQVLLRMASREYSSVSQRQVPNDGGTEGSNGENGRPDT